MVALRILFLLLPVCLFGQNIFEDRFPDADAGPIGATRDSRPGGQTVTYIQRDGNLSISNGSLVVPAQGTPASGDLSYYGAQTPPTLGQALFFKVVPTTLAFQTGVQPGALLGLSDNVDPVDGFDIWSSAGFGISGAGSRARVWPFFCPSTGTDEEDFRGTDTLVVNSTYSVAIVRGGLNSVNNEYDASPGTIWYQGQAESSFPYGQTFFIKKDNGNWIRQALLVGCSNDVAIGRPAITNYNSAFTVADFVLSKKIDLSLLQPLHYTSMAASNGTQLFDIIPEVGAAYDSVLGNFTVTSNALSATGSDPQPADIHWLTAKNMGNADVYGECLWDNITGNISIVFRYKSSDKSHLLVQFQTTVIRVFAYNGTSYSQVGPTTTFAHVSGQRYLARAMCIGNRIYAWNYDPANPDDENVMEVTSSLNQAETSHGIRTTTTGATVKYLRFWKAGSGGEYNQILNDYMAATSLVKRGNQ